MRNIIVAAMSSLLLAGCAGSVIGDAINPEGVAQREDAYCTSIGLKLGTPDYANCRMNLQAQTNANHQRALQNFNNGMRDIANQPPPGTPAVTVYSR
jgi:hypothetical protein